MRRGTAKGSLLLFGIVAGGTSLYGFLEGYGVGETLAAAFIISAFIVGIAWFGARMDQQLDRK